MLSSTDRMHTTVFFKCHRLHPISQSVPSRSYIFGYSVHLYFYLCFPFVYYEPSSALNAPQPSGHSAFLFLRPYRAQPRYHCTVPHCNRCLHTSPYFFSIGLALRTIVGSPVRCADRRGCYGTRSTHLTHILPPSSDPQFCLHFYSTRRDDRGMIHRVHRSSHPPFTIHLLLHLFTACLPFTVFSFLECAYPHLASRLLGRLTFLMTHYSMSQETVTIFASAKTCLSHATITQQVANLSPQKPACHM
jgi:hypothetical protein